MWVPSYQYKKERLDYMKNLWKSVAILWIYTAIMKHPVMTMSVSTVNYRINSSDERKWVLNEGEFSYSGIVLRYV